MYKGDAIMIFNPKSFGAKADGSHDDTNAIQQAIDKAFFSGGGRIVLKNGVFLSGTIYLKSNISLEIDASACLLASPDINSYGSDTHHNRYRNEPELDRCFIFAENADNIELCGNGIINGNAEFFPNSNNIYRPMMIRFLNCRNIRLHDLRLYNSAAWTTAFLDSERIFISNIDIKNSKNYNGDGLDFDGCSHIFVSGCSIQGTDDNLCLQSSSLPVNDVHISNCSFSSVCAAIRIGLKSIGSISDVHISHCSMKNVWREGIKIECSEGGNISDINIQDITMNDVSRPIFILLNNRFEPDDLGSSLELDHIPEIGTMSDIIISDIIASDSDEMRNTHYRFDDDVMGSPKFAGIRIDAEKNHPIRNLTLRNISYKFIGGVKLSDIPNEYPEVIDKLIDCDILSSENYYPDWSRASFMDIHNIIGLNVRNIQCFAIYPDERRGIITENVQFSDNSDNL